MPGPDHGPSARAERELREALRLGLLAVRPEAGQRGGQLAARGDAELGEDLAQVVLDRPRGQEQPSADLRVGQAVPGQARDEGLLRRQRGEGLVATLAYGLAGGVQLPARALSERLHPDRGQHVVGRAQLLARVGAPTFATQPLAVEQVRASQFRTEPGASQPVDRLAVQAIGVSAVAKQRPGACLDAEREIGTRGLRRLRQSRERIACEPGISCARGRLHELG